MVKTQTTVALLMLISCGTIAQADVVVSFGSGDNQFTIDFVTIGNPGNPADTTGDPKLAGSVPYVYNIGKYEISRDMVEKANTQGNLGITLGDFPVVNGGIRPDMPATGVTWYEAARFVNFLNTSHGSSAAYKFATQPGEWGYDPDYSFRLWQPNDPGYNANNPFRNSQAHYFLPSVDEWYKAAFYDPNANGGSGGYWNFPTGSDDVPTPIASGTDPGTAVWRKPVLQGPADITQAGGLSPYGTMAQAGNAEEWEETDFNLENNDSSFEAIRGVRGGSYSLVSDNYFYLLSASYRNYEYPITDNIGFRVASIPEPSTAYLGALSTIGVLRWRRRLS